MKINNNKKSNADIASNLNFPHKKVNTMKLANKFFALLISAGLMASSSVNAYSYVEVHDLDDYMAVVNDPLSTENTFYLYNDVSATESISDVDQYFHAVTAYGMDFFTSGGFYLSGTLGIDASGVGFTNTGTASVNSLQNSSYYLTNEGTFTVNSLQNYSRITDNGSLTVNSLQNSGQILGSGSLTLTGDSSNASGATIQTDVLINSGVTLSNSGTIYSDLSNDGTISGTGNVYLYGGYNSASGSISQNNITVMSSATTFNNSGSITGASSFSNGGTVINSGTIHAYTVNTGSIITSANNMYGTIGNDGDIEFTGGTNSNTITGTGTLNLSANITNSTGVSISQGSVEVLDSGITFTNNGVIAAGIQNNGTINGSGSLTINNGLVASANTGGITQNTVLITNGSTFNNSGSITATSFNNSGIVYSTGTINNDVTNSATGTLTTIAGNIYGKITNDGVLEFVNGINSDTVIGTGTTTIKPDSIAGALYASVTNNGIIQQHKVQIEIGGTLVSKADREYLDTVTQGGYIDNNGSLIFKGGYNENEIVSSLGTGSLVIDQDVLNTADIQQENFSIAADREFDNNEFGQITTENLTLGADSTLINRGSVTNTSRLTGTGLIINTGIMNFNTAISDNESFTGTYTQTAGVLNIANDFFGGDTIISGGVVNISDLTMPGTGSLTNDATINFSGTNNLSGIISGNGSGVINFGGNDLSYATISNNRINIAEGSALDNRGTINGNVYNNGTFTSDITSINGDVYNYSVGTYNLNVDGFNTLGGNISGGTGKTVITGISLLGNKVDVGDNTIDQSILVIASNNDLEIEANANSLQISNYIRNDNNLKLTGGTLNSDIIGTGELFIVGNVVNNAAVAGSSVTNSGVLTNNAVITADVTNDAGATLTTNASNIIGDIDNSGDIEFTGGVNNNAITDSDGTGNLTITGNVVNNAAIQQNAMTNSAGAILTNNAVITADVTNDAGATLTTNASNIIGDIDNSGDIEFTGGNNGNTISGTGTLTISGFVSNTGGAGISQGEIFIKDNATLLANADDLNSSLITNNGTLRYNGGTNDSNIVGAGDLEILNDTSNTAVIYQSKIIVSAGVTFDSDTSLLHAAMENLGDVTLTGGTNENAITGTGSLVIDDGSGVTSANVVNNANITQDSLVNYENLTNNAVITADVTNDAGATLTTNAGNIVGGIDNAGGLTFTGGVNNNVITDSNGTGNLTITGNVTNNEGVAITQSSMSVRNTGVFTADADDLTITDDIRNNGEIIFTGGTNNNGILGTGDVKITGDVTNTNGNDITQDELIISQLGSFTTDIDDIDADIENNGQLRINDSGSNDNAIIGTGDLLVRDSDDSTQVAVYNTAGIIQNALVNYETLNNYADINADITNYGLLTTNASKIAGDINNIGDLEFTGGVNDNTVTDTIGTGRLDITGNLTNNAEISQSAVTNSARLINNGSITAAVTNDAGAELITNANDIDGDINNNGDLEFTGGRNNNDVIGVGTMTVTGNVTNRSGASISQSQMIVDEDASFTADAGSLTLTNGLDNLGDVTFTGGTNNNDITGDGYLTITGNVTNTTGKTITQNKVTVTDTGSLTTSVEDISAVITNSGQLTLNESNVITTQNINYNIRGNGLLTINGTDNDLENYAFIEQDYIEINLTGSNYQFDNGINGNGIITANDLTLDGSTYLISNANNLKADVIHMYGNSELAFTSGLFDGNIQDDGKVNVLANGITTLTGNNTYTGDTELNDNAKLIISDSNNIGTGDIIFGDYATLKVKNDAVLNNNFSGGLHLAVEADRNVVLTGIIDAPSVFKKEGIGSVTILNENGNDFGSGIVISSGTLIGTTGSTDGGNIYLSDANSVMEFRQSYGAVLNGIFGGNGTVKIDNQGDGLISINNTLNADLLEIQNGLVSVNTGIVVTNVDVLNGATLQGVGTVVGNVNIHNGAVLAPGNSIGTFTTDDLTLSNGSLTSVEVSPLAADTIVATNSINIEAGADMEIINTSNDTYLNHVTHNIIQTPSLTGTFDYDGNVGGLDGARLYGELAYNATGIDMTMSRRAADFERRIETRFLSHNRVEVAKAMDNIYKLGQGVSTDMETMLMQMETLFGLENKTLIDGSARYESAVLELAGVVYANGSLAPFTNAKSAHVYDRIAQKAENMNSACPTCHDAIWANAYTSYDKLYANGDSEMYTNSISGTVAGYDRSSNETGILFGVMIGGGNSDIDVGNDRLDVHDYSLGVYGGYILDEWTIKGMLYGGYQVYDASRSIDFMNRRANAEYKGHSATFDTEVSYDFNWGVFGGVKMTPYVGTLVSLTHQRGFTEKGADALNLRVHTTDTENFQLRAGVKLVGEETEKYNWYTTLGLRQFLGSDYNNVKMAFAGTANTEMNIHSNQPGSTYYNVGFGGTYNINDSWKAFMNAEGAAGINGFSAFGNIGLTYQW